MDGRQVAVAAAIISLTAGPAFAASATGRITYISSDGHNLILDSNETYIVGPRVSLSSVGVADHVRVTFENRGGDRVITAIVSDPLKSGATG